MPYDYGRLENPPYYLTAYGIAVKHGYKGTEEEWIHEIQESAKDSSIAAAASAEAAAGSATAAGNAKTAAEAARDLAAEWAAGEEAGEPGEENNAAYFAGQASDSADAAAASAATARDYAEDTGGLVTDTVLGYLEETITNPDSPPLDRALASSEAAAPADLVGDLKSALDKSLKAYIQYNQADFTVEGYFSPDGSPHTDTSGNWYRTPSISLDRVTSISAKLYQNSSMIAPIVFYSAPMVVLSAVTTIDANAGNGVASGEISIPSGAKYVRFCVRNASSGQYVQLNYSGLQADVMRVTEWTVTDVEGDSETKVMSQAGFTEINAKNAKGIFTVNSFPNQGYIKTNGQIQSDTSGNFGYTDLIPIPYGLDEITVKLYCNPSLLAMVAFYDNAGIRISAVTTATGATSGQVYTGTIPVPVNAYFVRATKRTASGEQYVGYDTSYLDIANKAIATDNYVFAETLAKPFVNSGANAIGFGDSIMYGYNPLGEVSSNPWPTIVKDRCGFSNFTNRAVGGAGFTTGATIITQMTGQTLSTRDYIFIAAGTNDYHYAARLDAFETAVNTAFDYVDTNKGSQTKVVIITPINRSQAPGTSNGASIDAYRSILTKCALERGYSVIDGRNFGFPKTAYDSAYITSVLSDGLHPTDAGYVMYANHICGLLL